MSISEKFLKVCKSGTEYFLTGAGGVSFAIGMVALFVAVAPYISVPLIVGVGLVFGGYKAYVVWKRHDEQAAAEKRRVDEEKDTLDVSREVLHVAQDMNLKIHEIQEKIEHGPLASVSFPQDARFGVYTCPLPHQSPKPSDQSKDPSVTTLPIFFSEQKHREEDVRDNSAKEGDSPVLLPVIHEDERQEELPRVRSV